MDLGLAGRVALVTGASKGLGYATAEALVRDGASVVIVGRSTDALEAAALKLTQAATGDAHVVPIACDVTEPGSADAVVQATLDRFNGRIDILVPNSGGPPFGRAWDVDDEQLREAFEANCLTSIRLARAALPAMKQRQWGRICCITSNAVKQPIPVLALSNVARTGLWAWVKTAAMDVAADGITVNVAAPGLHDTDRVGSRGGSGARRLATLPTSAGLLRSCAPTPPRSSMGSRCRSTAAPRSVCCR